MSLRSEERVLRREHRQLLRRRRRAFENKHFSLAQRLGIKARRVIQKARTVHKRRVGDFHIGMLDGHPANVADQVKRLIALAYKFADQRGYVCTVTSTTGGGHASLSWHYILHGRNELGFAVDLIFATAEQMAEFQRFLLEHTDGGAGDFLELFGPDGFYVKNGIRYGGHFPDHGDHLHAAPSKGYRR
jgi:hypothetical protein